MKRMAREDVALFWKSYRTREKSIPHYSKTSAEDYLTGQLEQIHNTANIILDIREHRADFEDNPYVDKTLDVLEGALETSVTKVMRLAFGESSEFTQADLKSKVQKAAGDYLINKRQFRSAMLLATSQNQTPKRVSAEKERSSHFLEDIVAQDEGQLREFKKSFKLSEKIAISLAALSNTRGGDVYIGIAENDDVQEADNSIRLNENYSVVDVPRDLDLHRQKLISYISTHTNLDIADLKVRIIFYKGKRVLIIHTKPIFRKTGRVTFYKENAYVREDNHNRRLSAREVYELTVSKSIGSKTEYTYTREDIRKITVHESATSLTARAYYIDGSEAKDFKGYWYGFQNIPGKAPVWTPLGYGESSILKPSNFLEIHCYKYDYESNPDVNTNTFGVWSPSN